jgi:hypothetical protein
VWPDGAAPWRNVDRWPAGAARARAVEVFQRLNALDPAAVAAEELTPEAVPFLRFAAAAQEVFDAWRAALEHRRRAEEDHSVLLSTRALPRPAGEPVHRARGVPPGVDRPTRTVGRVKN